MWSPAFAVAFVFVAAKLAALLFAYLLLDGPDDYARNLSLLWDGNHYLTVAREGYPTPQGDGVGQAFAFAPMFPLLIWAVGAGDLAPLVVNNVASIFAVGFVTSALGWRGGLFFALFPLWLTYSSVGYSEGTFVLAAGAVIWATRHVPNASGLLAGLALMTRFVPGAAMAFAVAWPSWRRPGRLAVVVGTVGLLGASVLAWHWSVTGTPFAYLEAQRPWGATLGWPWQQFDWYLHGWYPSLDAVRLRVAPGGFALRNYLWSIPFVYGTWLLWQQPARRGLAIYCTFIVVLAFCAVGMPAQSAPRLLLAAFPALAAVGEGLRGPAAWTAYGTFGVLAGTWALTQHMTFFFM